MGKVKRVIIDFAMVSKRRLSLLRSLLECFIQAVRVQLRRINLHRLKPDAVAYSELKKEVDHMLSSLDAHLRVVAQTLTPEFLEISRKRVKDINYTLREGLQGAAVDEFLRILLRSKRNAVIEGRKLQEEFRPPQLSVQAARALIHEGQDELISYIQRVEEFSKTRMAKPPPEKPYRLWLLNSVTAADLLGILIRSQRTKNDMGKSNV